MMKPVVKYVADELLSEAARINQMRNDGLELDPQYVIDLLLKLGNELRDELKKECH